MNLRERIASWLAPSTERVDMALQLALEREATEDRLKRAAPMSFAPDVGGNFFGHGIASSQSSHDTLLNQNLGVSDMATRSIANRLGVLNPLVKVTRRIAAGTTEDEILDDHVLKVLLDRPHPNFTRQQLLRLTGQYIPTVGEAYWLKVRNGFGVPGWLSPMPPQNVWPIIGKGGIIESYRVLDGSGNWHTIQGSEVIRFWWPDPETLYTAEGYLGPNAINTDAARFASEHLRSRYQSDATPPIILKTASDSAVAPNDKQWTRWQKDYERKYHSRSGTHRGLPAMLPTGWDAILVAMSSGADITPLLDFWQSNQLMNFGTPASVLGKVVSGDRSSAEVNDYVFDKHTINPIAQLIAETLTIQLAADFDEKLFVEFEQFIAPDKEFRLKEEDQDLRNKVRSPQIILRDRNGDPEDAPWGEYPVGTLAEQPYTGEVIESDLPQDDMGALSVPDEEDDEEDGGPRVAPDVRWKRARQHFAPENEWKRVVAREKKWRPKFERAMRGVFEAQRKETLKKLKALELVDRAREQVTVADLFDPEAWDRIFELRVTPVRRAAYLDSAADALAGIGLEQTFEFTPIVTQILRDQDYSLIKLANETTQKRLARAISLSAQEGEAISALSNRINEAFGYRRRNAKTIARTELVKATQNAQLEGFKQSGVVERKQWNDSQDIDVRDSHVGSAIEPVRLSQPFTLLSGATAMHPGDPGLPVGEIANCRCFVTPLFDSEFE